jgi:hypothetical protein
MSGSRLVVAPGMERIRRASVYRGCPCTVLKLILTFKKGDICKQNPVHASTTRKNNKQ